MYNNLNDEIWESLLKAAVEENCLNQIKDYPPIDEINKIILPKHYDLIMRRLIKRYRFQSKAKAILKSSRKVASWIIIAMGISFALLLQSDEVRAACRNVITYVYEKYIRFDYEPTSNNEAVPVEFGFLPEGFHMAQSFSNEREAYVKFENDIGETIKLSYYFQNRTPQVDNEHYLISEISIGHYSGTFFESQNSAYDNCIVWNTENRYYFLQSSLDKDILIKIAENIN